MAKPREKKGKRAAICSSLQPITARLFCTCRNFHRESRLFSSQCSRSDHSFFSREYSNILKVEEYRNIHCACNIPPLDKEGVGLVIRMRTLGMIADH